MITCTTCQPLLLQHLYGLCDEADELAISQHLGGCPACREALGKAREQQAILAAAAKTPFPDVRFQAIEPSRVKDARRPVALPKRWRPRTRWALAASLLLAIGAGWAGLTWFSYSRAADRARKALASAVHDRDKLIHKQVAELQVLQNDMTLIQEQIALVEAKYHEELARVQREFDSQPVHFTVTHPKTLQAGGANQITIEAKRKTDPAKTGDYKMFAMVVDDKSKAEVARMALREGQNDFVLPANLPLKPGTQLNLRVQVAEAGKADKMVIDESLPLVTSLYVTHLTTDRPMYRPGEVVHFRSLTLERFGMRPVDEPLELQFRLVRSMGGQEQNVEVLDVAGGKLAQMIGTSRLKDEKGAPLVGPDGKALHGIGAGSFLLPAELPGGEYTLIVSETADRFPAEKRKLLVNRYQAPRLYKDVDFTRKSYGPGDVVTATCKVSPVEGGRVLAQMPVMIAATVDGVPCETVTKGSLKTDDQGQCIVQIRLPAKIERGEGVLSVTFSDGANVETTVEPIPIVIGKLNVDFYPEGGELIAGTANHVYFQVRTPLGKPAELRGQIIDNAGKAVAAIKTFSDDKEIGVNQGMGRFEFTPMAGQRYELKIESPDGIEGHFWLPPVQTSGVAMHIAQGVVTDKIDVVLHSAGKARKLMVGAYCRGQLLEHQTVKVDAGKQGTLTLKPATEVGGVYRVTVFEVDEDDGLTLKPIAERLLYRRSPEKLNLQVFTDKKSYAPGERVTLSLTSTDQHNKPAPAIVLVSVVDKSVLKLRNDRTARALPTHFLLTSEVRGPEDLEFADVLMRDDLPQAAVALDLMLGTQGWRRFVEQKLPAQQGKGLAVSKEDTSRLLAVNGQAGVKETLPDTRVAQAVNPLVVKYEKLRKALVAKDVIRDGKTAAAWDQQRALNFGLGDKQSTVREAERQLAAFLDSFRNIALIILLPAIAAVSLLLLFIVNAVINRKRLATRIYVVCGAFGAVVVITVAGLWFARDPNELDIDFIGGIAKNTFGLPRMHRVRVGGAERREVDQAQVFRGLGVGDGFGMEMPKAEAKKDMAKKEGLELLIAQPVQAPPMPQAAVGEAKDKEVELLAQRLQNLKKLQKAGKGFVSDLDIAELEKALGAKGKGKALDGKLRLLLERPQAQADAFGGGLGGLGGGKGGFGGGGMNAKARGNADGFVGQNGLLRLQDRAIDLNQAMVFARKVPLTGGPFVLRQYAHQHPTNPDNIRRDFTETVYWHPALVLPGDKAVDVSFDLSDAVTQFGVQVWGHTLDGRLGALNKDVASRLPFSLDAKLPIEISSTDKLAIAVAIANDSEKNRNVKLSVEADNLKVVGDAEYLLPMDANSRLRKVVQLVPSKVQGEAKLRLLGLCEPFGSDSIERIFKIVPEGFPVAAKHSGLLERLQSVVVTLPAKRDEWVPGTLKLQAQVFPSTLADLQKGLEALLREPGGCFEQTSSSNYPNIMILDYLKESGQIQPVIEKKARALLDTGYGRLIAFECIDPVTRTKKQGYEWFGQTAPPHEALTAYGLLQFLDMAKYHEVDKAMLERTKQYLLGQRNGKGGFLRNTRAIDGFGRAPDHITDAYIVWALAEAEVKEDISREINAVTAKATESDDPYLLALSGLSLLKRGQSDAAMSVLKKLQAKQKDDGSLIAAQTSITHSGGTQLTVETTSLGLLAWLRANRPQEFSDNIRKAADWIGKQRGAFGGYGSTQSTILALKALIAFTKENKKTAEAGEIRLFVKGRAGPVAVKAFPAGTQEQLVVELPDEMLLEPGDNTVRVEITGKNVFPYTVSWTYMALTPANKHSCPVRLTTKLASVKAAEGQSLAVTAVLENASGQDQGMAVAIIGLPGGCSLPTDLQELRNLVKAGKIDAFEVRGRELVIYWRGLGKDAKHEVNFSVICQVPGQYRGPASRAYLYYNTDERWWVPPLAVDVAAK